MPGAPHRVSVRGKAVNLNFVSIFGRNLRRLILSKNKTYRFLYILQQNHNVLIFTAFGHVSGSSCSGNATSNCNRALHTTGNPTDVSYQRRLLYSHRFKVRYTVTNDIRV